MRQGWQGRAEVAEIVCWGKPLAKRLFEGGLKARREELSRPVRGDGHDVFAADAEFVGDVYTRFVGEGHARLKHGGATLDEIGVLVNVQADAVADAMGKEFVAGAEAGGSDDGARGGVHGAAEAAGAGRIEGCVLRAANGFEDELHFFGGLAENAGARNIGPIAFDGAAVINQDNVAFLEGAGLLAAVR